MKKLLLTILCLSLCATASAAVTVSKGSTGYLTVLSGSTGDLDDVVAATADADYITKVGNKYIINANDVYASPKFIIAGGASIDHHGDGWELEWVDPENNTYSFYTQPGSNLTLSGGGWTIHGTTSTDEPYWYLRGATYLIGEPDNWGTVRKYDQVYVTPDRSTPNNFTHFNYINFRENSDAGAYLRINGQYQYLGDFLLENIDIRDGAVNQSYGFYYGYIVATEGQIVRDLTVSGCSYGALLHNASGRLTRVTIKDSVSYAFNGYQLATTVGKERFGSLIDEKGWYSSKGNYPVMFFDECTFLDNDADVHNLLTYYGSVLAFKDCLFKNTDGTGTNATYIGYDSVVLDCGGNTFETTATNWNLLYGSSRFDCYQVSIQVVDTEGNPLEDAGIAIGATTPSDPNTCLFKLKMNSTADGYFNDAMGYAPWMPYYETGDLGNTRAIPNYQYMVGHPTKKPVMGSFTLDGPKTMVITMEDADAPDDIIINNATINNSTIG